ncbi:hypothetical protein IVA87_08020 [Bradyrhizobium sp. 147]|uniref:phage major capsid protein n=1 Tax=Bradyrhizobium sp. 147 TaxID=2782623 RepID=UPI001FF89BC2|nr:phage major capsid protein [Bradyrhizobium sp. 147]MCK1679406.1 hypothetical protein [Bradyrhizobium sp. 147]
MIHDRFRRDGGAVFIRTAARVIKAVANDDFADRNARSAGDIDVSLLLKAATSPATTSSSNWAGSLASTAVADFIGSLGPLSAAARLIAAGVTASLDGLATVEIPRRQGGKPSGDVAWVAEGGAIPVRQYVFDSVTLGPTRKLPILTAISREAAASGEDAIGMLVREDTAASLDASVLSAASADASRPAGILAGLTAIPAANLTDDSATMIADLEAIGGAIADAGGSGDVVYIMAPRQALSAKLRLGTSRGVTVWPSAGLPSGTVVGVQPDAFVSGFGATPRITASIEATVHMDTAALSLSEVGTPSAILAAPIKSAFQGDFILLKCILDCAWAMRAEGRVAFVEGAHWGTAP